MLLAAISCNCALEIVSDSGFIASVRFVVVAGVGYTFAPLSCNPVLPGARTSSVGAPALVGICCCIGVSTTPIGFPQ